MSLARRPSLHRRTVLYSAALAATLLAASPLVAHAQAGGKNTLTIGVTLEPAPGLDPTGGAASACLLYTSPSPRD